MTDGSTGQTALERAIEAALDGVADPSGKGGLVACGRLEGVRLQGGRAEIALRTGRDERQAMSEAAAAAERAVTALDGIERAMVILTSHREGQAQGHGQTAARPAPASPSGKPKLLGFARRVIAVASGKGGVGKSTVSVNLAIALAREGLAVGLLDADIHGPSLPRMLGIDRRPGLKDKRIQPLQAFGLTAMSIGFMVDERQAMIWRGPMVMGALEQLMAQVDWPDLDVMVIDMPPGTGDAQLTLSQKVDVAGAVIVSTPQDIALIDARRAISMFGTTGVPILGIVENMSVFHCPRCGHESHPFGHGGARREAEALGVPFLGEVPLRLDVRAAGDSGRPVEGEAASAFDAIAAGVRERLGL